MKLSDLKKDIKIVKDSQMYTHGISVGKNCVIDGPIATSKQIHVISHAHSDHVTDRHIAHTMRIKNGKMLTTEPTKRLLRHGVRNRNVLHDYRFEHLNYGELSEPFTEHGDTQFELKDAGHILGSAQVKIIDPQLDFSFGYSGDIGSKVHNPLECDVLVLDATYSNIYDDGSNFSRDDVFNSVIKLVNYSIKNGMNLHISGGNGILQELLHVIGSETVLWEINPDVYTDKKQIIEWVNVYKEYPEKGKQPLNLHNLMDDEFRYGKGILDYKNLVKNKKQIIKIFNNSNDIQNHGSRKDLILNIDNSPFTRIKSLKELEPQKDKYFYNLPLTAHETGESMLRYIELVNPSVILTDVRGGSNNDLELSKNILSNFSNIKSWSTRELEFVENDS